MLPLQYVKAGWGLIGKATLGWRWNGACGCGMSSATGWRSNPIAILLGGDRLHLGARFADPDHFSLSWRWIRFGLCFHLYRIDRLAIPGLSCSPMPRRDVGFAYFGANAWRPVPRPKWRMCWSLDKVCMFTYLPSSWLCSAFGALPRSHYVVESVGRAAQQPYVMTARVAAASRIRAVMKYPVRVAPIPITRSDTCCRSPFPARSSFCAEPAHSGPRPCRKRDRSGRICFWPAPSSCWPGALTVVGTFHSDLLLMWVVPRIRLGRQ